MFYPDRFEIIIIGGGHAGTEAAMASARIGCKTILLTNNIDTLGQMSCNPAIGGIGKGHLVKEIDAMGGLMAQAIDQAGIQFKTLNASKGPAVRATRVQADRILYKQIIRQSLENQPNLIIFQQIVNNLIIKNDRVIGVVTHTGLELYAQAVVLTVGTFLDGKIYIGDSYYQGGRMGDPSSIALSKNLRKFSFRVNRFKTGTPPRIDSHSIDFKQLVAQYSDNPLPTFSFLGAPKKYAHQIPCYITHTNEKTHDIIRNNISLSPIYSGIVKGFGPRYCPSIEDKIIRFANRNSHQIFLEPEGLTSKEIYPNGISTSLPFDIQIKIIRSIKGLEKANIMRPGYVIEYDYFDPRDLKLTLESKFINRLFFAGQINGTTGYEEAAAQGMLAGLNAALLVMNKDSWIPRRDQAYLGVLVDDLCTIGIKEPYRMFTSRSEYRLLLREDNADIRLTEIGRQLNMVDDIRWIKFCNKLESIEKERQRLRYLTILPGSREMAQLNTLLEVPFIHETNGEDILRRTKINYQQLTKLDFFKPTITDTLVAQQIETQIKYQGYIARQQTEINNQIYYECILLPDNIDYNLIPGLSNEAKINLNDYKPNSIGQASRIFGVTPASISILIIWLKKHGFLRKKDISH